MESGGLEDFAAENVIGKDEFESSEELGMKEEQNEPVLEEHVDTKEDSLENTASAECHEPEKDDNDVKPIQKSDKKTSWPAVWLEDHQVNKNVVGLIYWQDYKQTGLVFGGIITLLLSFAYYPVLCVATTFIKALLAVSLLFRIGMPIVNAIQKTTVEHPLKHLLEETIEIGEDAIAEWPEKLRLKVNDMIRQAQLLFLIHDFIDSLKFGVMLWLISYVASWFSFLTLITIPLVAAFTVPRFYESYQDEVDNAVQMGKSKFLELFDIVDSKVPPNFKFYNQAKKSD